MKPLSQSLPSLIFRSNLSSGRRGARATANTWAQTRGKGVLSYFLGAVAKAGSGFPSLGETRLHLVEVELQIPYSGCTEHECKFLLKCTGALNSCVVSVLGTAASAGGAVHPGKGFLEHS